MNTASRIPEHDYQCLKDLLTLHLAGIPTKVYLYGSRAKGTARERSDIDLCLKAKVLLPQALFNDVVQAVQDSNMALKADLLDWHAISPEFQAAIAPDFMLLLET